MILSVIDSVTMSPPTPDFANNLDFFLWRFLISIACSLD